jgi:DNA-binding NarL/FixJ family response regulator
MPSTLTLVIADDHAIFRQALRLTLVHRGRGLTVAAEAENGDDTVRAVGEHRPDVLVLDLGLPKKSTRDVIEEVRRVSPATRIVILTGFADLDNVRLAALAGAKAFVLKDGPLEPLLEAIERVARGEVWADPMLPMVAHEEFVRVAGDAGARADPLRGLSSREREVLELVAGGLSNRDIGARLSISEKTVTSHLNRVFDKLGVESRLQAALVYTRAVDGRDR